MKFSLKDSFSKYDQIRRKLQIWSHLLNEFLMETSFFVKIRLERRMNVLYTFSLDCDYIG